MICFKRASLGMLSGGLLIAIAVSAIAQQATPPQLAIVRFPLGMQFEVPQGWSWRDYRFNSSFSSVAITYDATRPQDLSKDNPNYLQVVFNPKGLATESVRAAQDWTRVDTDRSQTLPNGALVRWKIGKKWNAHEVLNGSATIGSTTIGFGLTDGSTRTFNPKAVVDALLKISGSMRVVAPSSSHFHPVLRMAIEPPDAKRWSLDITEYGFNLHCLDCGNASNSIAISSSKTPRADLNAALAVLTNGTGKQQKLTIGEVRREATAVGEVAWTEQPGSEWPFLGAFRIDNRYFFISLQGKKTTPVAEDALRKDFLTAARGVRVWSGE